jgi:integrase
MEAAPMGTRIPAYRLHKTSGRAVVTINGREIYLGKHGTIESRLKYSEIIARHAGGLPVVEKPAVVASMSVNGLVLAYMRHAETYYLKNGKPTSEIDCYKMANRPLVDLYGDTRVSGFGPLMLMAVQQKMIEEDKLCRKSINQAISRIRTIFRWGVAREIVPATVLNALEALEPLKRGRTTAREPARRKPVADTNIARVKAIVPERTADLIELQLLTGARSGELIMLTGKMIDRSGDIWLAKLPDHKNVHHDQERTLVFGPKAQSILRKYILLDESRKLFTLRRDSYGKAIKDACLKLKIPVWTPHWLRHNAATRLRADYGLDVAQAMLGNSSADVTQLYAELDMKKASEAARHAG